jgi:hypothetical protein
MQYAQKITFEREIVLAVVLRRSGTLASKLFYKGETLSGVVQNPCEMGHHNMPRLIQTPADVRASGTVHGVVSVVADVEATRQYGPTFQGGFTIANCPADAITIENLPEE